MEQLFNKLYEIYNEGKKDDGLIANLRNKIGELTFDDAEKFGEYILTNNGSKQMPALKDFLKLYMSWVAQKQGNSGEDSGNQYVEPFVKYCRSAASFVRSEGGVCPVVFENDVRHRAWLRYFEFHNYPMWVCKLPKIGVPTDFPSDFDEKWGHNDKNFKDIYKKNPAAKMKNNTDAVENV